MHCFPGLAKSISKWYGESVPTKHRILKEMQKLRARKTELKSFRIFWNRRMRGLVRLKTTSMRLKKMRMLK